VEVDAAAVASWKGVRKHTVLPARDTEFDIIWGGGGPRLELLNQERSVLLMRTLVLVKSVDEEAKTAVFVKFWIRNKPREGTFDSGKR
jgi:hypothetical protein